MSSAKVVASSAREDEVVVIQLPLILPSSDGDVLVRLGRTPPPDQAA